MNFAGNKKRIFFGKKIFWEHKVQFKKEINKKLNLTFVIFKKIENKFEKRCAPSDSPQNFGLERGERKERAGSSRECADVASSAEMAEWSEALSFLWVGGSIPPARRRILHIFLSRKRLSDG